MIFISVNAPQPKKSCSENVFWQQRAVKANQSRSTVQSFCLCDGEKEVDILALSYTHIGKKQI